MIEMASISYMYIMVYIYRYNGVGCASRRHHGLSTQPSPSRPPTHSPSSSSPLQESITRIYDIIYIYYIYIYILYIIYVFSTPGITAQAQAVATPSRPPSGVTSASRPSRHHVGITSASRRHHVDITSASRRHHVGWALEPE